MRNPEILLPILVILKEKEEGYRARSPDGGARLTSIEEELMVSLMHRRW